MYSKFQIMQSEINMQEFQDAEPDTLVSSTSAILEHFNLNCYDALQAFCKKKGLDAKVIQNFDISPSNSPLIFLSLQDTDSPLKMRDQYLQLLYLGQTNIAEKTHR
jgi:hypothetical protein